MGQEATKQSKRILTTAVTQLGKKDTLTLGDIIFMTYPSKKLKDAKEGLNFSALDTNSFSPSVQKELFTPILTPYVESKGITLEKLLDSSFNDFILEDLDEIIGSLQDSKTPKLAEAELLGQKLNAFVDSLKVYDDIVGTQKDKIYGDAFYKILNTKGKSLVTKKFPTVLPFGVGEDIGKSLNKINSYFDRVNIISLENSEKMQKILSEYKNLGKDTPKTKMNKAVKQYRELYRANALLDAGKDLSLVLMFTGFRNAEALSLEIFDEDAGVIEKDLKKGTQIKQPAIAAEFNLKRSNFRRYLDAKTKKILHHIHIPTEVTKTSKVLGITVGEKLSRILEKRAAISQMMGAKQLFAIPSMSYLDLQAKFDLGLLSKEQFDVQVKALKNPIDSAFTYGIIDNSGYTAEGKSKSSIILDKMFGKKAGDVFEFDLPNIAYNESSGKMQGSFTAHAFRRFFATFSDEFTKFLNEEKGYKNKIYNAEDAMIIKSYLQGRVGDIDISKLEGKAYRVQPPYSARPKIAAYMDDFFDYIVENAAPEGQVNLLKEHLDKTTIVEKTPLVYNPQNIGNLITFDAEKIEDKPGKFKKVASTRTGKSIKNFKVNTTKVGSVVTSSAEELKKVEVAKNIEDVHSRDARISNALERLDDQKGPDDYSVSKEYYEAKRNNPELAARMEKQLMDANLLDPIPDTVHHLDSPVASVSEQSMIKGLDSLIDDGDITTQSKLNNTRLETLDLEEEVKSRRPSFQESTLDDMQKNLELERARRASLGETLEEKISGEAAEKQKITTEEKLRTTTLEDVLERNRAENRTVNLEKDQIVKKGVDAKDVKGFSKAAKVVGKALPFVGLGVGVLAAKDALGKDPSEFAQTEGENILMSKTRQYVRAGSELLSGISPIPLDLSLLNLANPVIPGEESDLSFRTFGEMVAPTKTERATKSDLSDQMESLNLK